MNSIYIFYRGVLKGRDIIEKLVHEHGISEKIPVLLTTNSKFQILLSNTFCLKMISNNENLKKN